MSVIKTMTVFDGACPVCAMDDSVVECNGCKQNWCQCCGSGGDCTCIINWAETPCPYCGEQAIVQCNTCEHTGCNSCGAGGYCNCIQCGQCGDWHRCQS